MESANALVAENRGYIFMWDWVFVRDSIPLFDFSEDITDDCALGHV